MYSLTLRMPRPRLRSWTDRRVLTDAGSRWTPIPAAEEAAGVAVERAPTAAAAEVAAEAASVADVDLVAGMVAAAAEEASAGAMAAAAVEACAST